MESNRIKSIDIFRGLTILTMIFVNDVASVKEAPWWMKHMPGDVSGMTFVDVVFPAFLFIVGMSIPLAVLNRRKKGFSDRHIFIHMLIRTAGLLVLGVFMVNMHDFSPEFTGMSKHVWKLLFYVSVILVWNLYPQAEGRQKILLRGLRVFGICLLGFLAFVYRSSNGTEAGWMHTYWWGILGLIGWAYITTGCVFFLCKNKLHSIIGTLAFFIALYIGDKTGALSFIQPIKEYIWIGGHIGGHAAICTAGLLVSLVFLKESSIESLQAKIQFTLWFAIGLAVCGYLLQPLYGINKNMATPAWDLYSASICCVVFILLFWLADKNDYSHWFRFLKPAGANPLLAYILPDIFYTTLSFFHFTFYHELLGAGPVGIFRAFVFAIIILFATQVLTTLKIRLQL